MKNIKKYFKNQFKEELEEFIGLASLLGIILVIYLIG